MSTNNYKITIHISRTNTISEIITNVPFPNSVLGRGDKISFSKQKITIQAVRTKKYTPTEIVTNKNNSLYGQIFKSLIYLYVVNGNKIKIISIDIERHTKRIKDPKISFDISSEEQPIKYNFALRYPISNFVKNKIWEECNEAYSIRAILTLWLATISSNDRYYIFERSWRTFERLCFYKSRAISDLNEFTAIKNIKDYIYHNLPSFNDSITIASSIGIRDLKKYDWSGYIKSEFLPLSKSTKSKPYTEKYKNHLVICNTDWRIMTILRDTLSIREAELRHHNVYNDIVTHITTQLGHNVVANEQVLCFLCCKYAYFLRNKMFHGEKTDYTFTFSKDTIDNKMIDKLNYLLSSLINELLLIIDRL
ncbi:hypothetical protein [uncultured Bacteroides sp.]|uniref:hypothetical protein n=1 Tax=uncultured Bacteroides sp. TaxID=162156 RepID=UPI002670A9F5|nr:hypothetical protein [uncultured Bacteroides sp.]